MSTVKTSDTSRASPKNPKSLTTGGKTIAVGLTETDLERANGGNRPIIVVC